MENISPPSRYYFLQREETVDLETVVVSRILRCYDIFHCRIMLSLLSLVDIYPRSYLRSLLSKWCVYEGIACGVWTSELCLSGNRKIY